MNPAILHRPFFQITLPIMLTIIAGAWAFMWSSGRHFDRIMNSFDDLERRLNATHPRKHD